MAPPRSGTALIKRPATLRGGAFHIRGAVMGLDILTPRGQQTVRDEEEAAAVWELANPAFKYCRTPKDMPSAVDAVIVGRNGLVMGVVESKCRYGVTEESFKAAFRNEWLVTMEKLVKGANLARALCVPYYGFLYLVDSRTLLTQKIADSAGQFCVPFRCDNTATRKTVNGGEATRANAYIDMTECRVFRAPKPCTTGGSTGTRKTKTMAMTSGCAVALDSSVQPAAKEAHADGQA